MTVAQGIKKQVAYKKQSGLGTVASGSGGQLIRRESANFNVTKDTYSNNEIVSHQQHTGDVHGVRKSAATLGGVLSGLTYQSFFESLLRKAAAATSSISSLSLTIAASGSNYTVTRAAGSFLSDGAKIGDVVRLSGGSLNASNSAKNLLIIGLTATVATVVVVNSSAMVAEGPIASCTMSFPGKKMWVPTSGHTNDYYTFEEWFSDLSKNHIYPDMQIASADVSIPATGNVAVSFPLIGLGARTKGSAQTLTSPSAETTSSVLASVAGAVIVNGVRRAVITSMQFTIDGSTTHGEAVVGSNSIPDTQKGRVKVSGSFSYLYEDDTIGNIFDDESAVAIAVAVADSQLDAANFVGFAMSAVKVFSDDADDGEKQIVRSANFTAQIQSAGGSGTAYDQTIIAVQDSLAV